MVFTRTVRYMSSNKDFVPKDGIETPEFPIIPPPSPQLQDEYVLLVMRVGPRDFDKVDANRLTLDELDRVRALGYPLYWYEEPPGNGQYHAGGSHGGAGGCIVMPGEPWKIF